MGILCCVAKPSARALALFNISLKDIEKRVRSVDEIEAWKS